MSFKELLLAAKEGDADALNTLIEMYKPLITKYSYFIDTFDEDLYQEQILRFIHCIKKFSEEFPDSCNKVTHSKRDYEHTGIKPMKKAKEY